MVNRLFWTILGTVSWSHNKKYLADKKGKTAITINGVDNLNEKIVLIIQYMHVQV